MSEHDYRDFGDGQDFFGLVGDNPKIQGLDCFLEHREPQRRHGGSRRKKVPVINPFLSEHDYRDFGDGQDFFGLVLENHKKLRFRLF